MTVPRLARATLSTLFVLTVAVTALATTAAASGSLHETRAVTSRRSLCFFGNKVAVHGDTLVVTAFTNHPSCSRGGEGVVTIFQRIDGAWVRQQQLEGENLGHSLAFDGNQLVLGDFDKVHVYERDAGVWSLAQTIAPERAFWSPIALHEDLLAVLHAPGLHREEPLATVYRRVAGRYRLESRIFFIDTSVFAERAVAFNGRSLFLGFRHSFGTTARIYERTGGVGPWNRVQELDIDEPWDWVRDAAFDGDRLAVLVRHPDSVKVHLFERGAGGYEPIRTLTPPADYAFQDELDFENDRLVVGACLSPNNTTCYQGPTGAVVMFERRPWGGWVQDRVVEPIEHEDRDEFGDSVDLQGGQIAVGRTRAPAYVYAPVPVAGGVEVLPVYHPGNAPDPISRLGRVTAPYFIGRAEVTNAEYVDFLNAVDPDLRNDRDLFDPAMASEAWGGIAVDPGRPEGWRYVARPLKSDHPVNYVDWRDAARYANWLHNGRPLRGGTETGAYDLADADPVREPGARFALPSEDEWYKTAFHDPERPGIGILENAGYFPFPTGTDEAPEPATCSYGRVLTPGPNVVNYDHDCVWANVGNPGFFENTSPVGGTAAPGPYGTFDQGGNVWEWLDTGSRGERFTRGGGFDSSIIWLASSPFGYSGSYAVAMDWAARNRGFRVVYLGERTGAEAEADLDGDGIVGMSDFGALSSCFGLETGDSVGPAADPTCGRSDLNDDGRVGIVDFGLLSASFGQ